jgi:alpha-N-arabinofuranosidase
MHLSFDEWNVEPGTWKGNTAEPWTVGPAICEGGFTMADAVVFGTMMMSLIKHSDRIRIACLAQLVNVFGAVMTDPISGKAWRQSVYYPFQLTSQYGRGTALPVRLESPTYRTPDNDEVPMLEAVSVWNEAQDELVLFIVSRSLRDNVELELELRGFGGWTTARCLELYDEDPNAINSADDPDRIAPRESDALELQDNRLRLQLRPVSWNMIRIGREQGVR